jgi:hypothetical protein
MPVNASSCTVPVGKSIAETADRPGEVTARPNVPCMDVRRVKVWLLGDRDYPSEW